MYAVPDAGTWKIVLNSALGKSGSELPDPALDVASVEVPANEVSPVREQFTIDLKPTGAGVIMELKWDHILVAVEIS